MLENNISEVYEQWVRQFLLVYEFSKTHWSITNMPAPSYQIDLYAELTAKSAFSYQEI